MSDTKENLVGNPGAEEKSGALKRGSHSSLGSNGIPEEIETEENVSSGRRAIHDVHTHHGDDKAKKGSKKSHGRKKGKGKERATAKDDAEGASDSSDDAPPRNEPEYPDDLSKTQGDGDGIAHVRDEVLAELGHPKPVTLELPKDYEDRDGAPRSDRSIVSEGGSRDPTPRTGSYTSSRFRSQHGPGVVSRQGSKKRRYARAKSSKPAEEPDAANFKSVQRNPNHLDSVQAARQRLVERDHRDEPGTHRSRFARPRKDPPPGYSDPTADQAARPVRPEAGSKSEGGDASGDGQSSAPAPEATADDGVDPPHIPKMPIEESRGEGFDKSKLFDAPILPFHFTDHILSVKVHKTEALRPSMYVQHPVIQVHFVNERTGEYLVKQPVHRTVTGINENCTWNDRSVAYNYILPAMTKPYSLRGKTDLTLEYDEELLWDEDYLGFLERDVVMLLEVIDFVGFADMMADKTVSDGWARVAWGFLRLVSKSESGRSNTEKPVRLQLYQYLFDKKMQRAVNPHSPLVFQCWKYGKRVHYPATVYVTVSGRKPPREVNTYGRSKHPRMSEVGRLTWDELQAISLEKYGALSFGAAPQKKASGTDLGANAAIDRIAGQACRIPNKFMTALPSGLGGCMCIRFSPEGRFLAAGCSDRLMFVVKVWEVKTWNEVARLQAHHDIIYDLSWSSDETELCSASADCTVSVFNLKIDDSEPILKLQHPTYVYASQFHPTSTDPRQIVSGGFDRIIRIWNRDTGMEIRQLTGHASHINSIAFNLKGNKMFSADAKGVIKGWNSRPSDLRTAEGYDCFKTIADKELRDLPITSIRVIPTDLVARLLIHTQDNLIRVMDLRVYNISQRLAGSQSSNYSIKSVFSPDGKYVLSGSEDGKAYIWSENGDVKVKAWDVGFPENLCDADWHPKKHMIALCCFSKMQPIRIFSYVKSEGEVTGDEPPAISTAEQLQMDKKEADAERARRSQVQTMAEERAREKYDKIAGLMASVTYGIKNPTRPSALVSHLDAAAAHAKAVSGTSADPHSDPTGKKAAAASLSSAGSEGDPAMAAMPRTRRLTFRGSAPVLVDRDEEDATSYAPAVPPVPGDGTHGEAGKDRTGQKGILKQPRMHGARKRGITFSADTPGADKDGEDGHGDSTS